MRHGVGHGRSRRWVARAVSAAPAGESFPLPSDFRIYGRGNVRPHRCRFDAGDPAFLSRSRTGQVTFRLLAPSDVAEGTLAVRMEGAVVGYQLERIGAAGAVSLWQATLRPPAERFECSFALLLTDGVAVYLSPTGITNAIERLDRFEVDVDAVPLHDVPEWAAGAVMYQVFPDRFALGDTPAATLDLSPWDTLPNRGTFLGGDLDGLAARIDHLVDLAVEVVYLNPVFTSPSNHRYDTVDYYHVDPMLGGNAALHRLVETLHRHDIRLILDTSFNHCHPRFFAFADVVANGPESDFVEWFVVHDWPVRVRARPHLLEPGSLGQSRLDRLGGEGAVPVDIVHDDGPAIEPLYDSWYGVPSMPRVNLAHPDARRYMLDVAAYWIREFDVDGWRMDVVRYVDHDFWADMRRVVRAVKPDAYLLAEVMGDARRWLAGDEFDGVMNYTFRQLIVDYFATDRIDTTNFLEGLLEMTAMYSPAAASVNQNLIGSHDKARFLTVAGGERRRLLLATLLQMTFPGIAGLYYGDEVAMEGGGDPDNRRGMTWDAAGNEHHAAVMALTQLRRRIPALRHGDWRLLTRVGEAFAYERRLGDERPAVAINRSDRSVDLPLRTRTLLWFAGDVGRSTLGVRLGPWSGALFDRDGHRQIDRQT